jgi:hypothetical protein
MTTKEKDDIANDPQYEIDLELADSVRLKIHIFNRQEQRWIFTFHYIKRQTGERKPVVVNDQRLVVDFDHGIATTCTLIMNITIPERLGKVMLYGMDVSPGAKTHLQFNYEKMVTPDLTCFQLVSVEKGATQKVELKSMGPGLVKPIQFPFPILDKIVLLGTYFLVPFLGDNDQEKNIKFPGTIQTK